MEIEGKEYDIKCECGTSMIRTNPQEPEPLDLQCPTCKQEYCIYPNEAELFEKVSNP